MTTKKIRGDHARFRKKINGKLNERLKEFIKTGHIMRMRPDGKGKMSVPIQQVDQPQFIFGKPEEGVTRGPGEPGDVIDKEWEPGKGPGAGDGGETGGVLVDVDMEDVIAIMEDDLCLPRMKPKNFNTFEALKTRYNGISKNGPRSLIHRRRTIKEAMKRSIAQGTWGKKVLLPGFSVPLPALNINDRDFLYRQWNQEKIPRANALIVFGRDGSGSMDDFKCNIVNDLAFWIETWIGRDYEKSESLYLWHDVDAQEVSKYDFYHKRHGTTTVCSSIVQLLKKLIKLKYPPEKWNIYFIYFGDGDNSKSDNVKFMKCLLELEDSMNMAAVVQVLADHWDGSLCQYVEEHLDKFKDDDFIRTSSVGGSKEGDGIDYYGFSSESPSHDENIDAEMKRAIVDILGIKHKESSFEGVL